MIQRIAIRGYKSIRDLDLRLENLTVLIGPNAAGKSNFLDALQLMSRLAGSRTLIEAFAPPYRGKPLESFWFGDQGLEGLTHQKSASFSIEVDVDLAPKIIDAVDRQIAEMRGRPGLMPETGVLKSYIHHRLLRYGVEIGISPKTGQLFVLDEYLAPLNSAGKPKGKPLPFLQTVEHRLHLRMEGQSHPTYLDLRLDHTVLSRPHYPPHYPHLTALKREFESWFFYYLEPRERMRAASSVKEVRHIGLMGEELASFLNTLRAIDPKQFQGIEKAIHHLIPSITGIQTKVNKFGEVELSILEDGIEVPARVVSEGTLRILGLLALLGAKDTPSVIGFEEPENGIHPRRIREVARMLSVLARKDAQVIVTTHSPILPDYVDDKSLFLCRRTGGKTSIRPYKASWGPLGRPAEIEDSLDDSGGLTVSRRLMRGDLDA